MFLIKPGQKPKPICREHGYAGKGCPKCRIERERRRQVAGDFMLIVDEAKRLVAAR